MEVRTDYYKDALPTKCHNLKDTVNIVNRFAGQERTKVLPWHYSKLSQTENFVEIFHATIKSIRWGIEEKLLSVPCHEINEGNCESSRSEVVFTDHFSKVSALDISCVHEIFVEVNKTYCFFDPILISVTVIFFELLVAYFLDVMNLSLLSGVFSHSLKYAITSPVLKDLS